MSEFLDLNGLQVFKEQLESKFGGGGSSTTAPVTIVPITYSALVTLRNGVKLAPGTWYRITDYTASASQYNVVTMGHVFDILVMATSTSRLSEEAFAMKHEGDSYFAGTNFAAWEVRYCLDNDTARFAWAVSSGKGVIYHLKDEFGNCCPYDFKNICFILPATFWTQHSKLGQYFSDSEIAAFPVYTFSMFTANPVMMSADASVQLNTSSKMVYENVVEPYRVNGKMSLPLNLFLDSSYWYGSFSGFHHNHLMADANDNVILFNSHYNTIGKRSSGNVISFGCSYNTLGTTCNNIETDYLCSYNVFHHGCYNIRLGYQCQHNDFGALCRVTFGDRCSNNVIGFNAYANFGTYCLNNRVGDSSELTLGGSSSNNNVGHSCKGISFQNSCTYNVLNDGCWTIILSSNCSRNTFGAGCYDNTLGSSSSDNLFEVSSHSNNLGANCSKNRFGVGTYENFLNVQCEGNVFGVLCHNNELAADCSQNVFGNECKVNTLYQRCVFNTFGDNCFSMVLGGGNTGNVFAMDNYANTLAAACSYNTFGIACNNNNLASGSSYNVFENRSRNNVVAAYCESITFGIGSCDVAIKKSFMRYITIEAGVAYLDISCSATTSSAAYGQNIRIRSGVAGTATSRKLATITSANNSFLTTFGNSADVSGTLRLSTQA